MKERTFYLLIIAGVVAAFYFGLPQNYLGDFASIFTELGSTISFKR